MILTQSHSARQEGVIVCGKSFALLLLPTQRSSQPWSRTIQRAIKVPFLAQLFFQLCDLLGRARHVSNRFIQIHLIARAFLR